MRVTRLSLTNFRVFPELDLELPPGVVGIYGPNGSGKSTLVEAILWALFGVARTGKESIRSDGATGECRAVVEFEHDGHLYEVTRAISGAANTVKVEAHCDGTRLAAGVQAVRQYVHHILGMSADAFRASVFCEQKQLDAFSGRRPEERRRLVLDLLGITPLDRARDNARSQARAAREGLEAARLVLGDLDALAAEAAALGEELDAAAEVRGEAAARVAAAAEADARTDADAVAFEARKVERDRLAAAWNQANARAAEATRRVTTADEELTALTEAATKLPALEEAAAGLDAHRRRLQAVETLAAARARLARAEAAVAPARRDNPQLGGLLPEPVAGQDDAGQSDRGQSGTAGALALDGLEEPGRPRPTDPALTMAALEDEAAAAARAAGESAGRVAGLDAARTGAAERLRAAAAEVEAAGRLDPDAPCPLCGQELGGCFESVQSAREAARADAETTLARAAADLAQSQSDRLEAERRAQAAETRLRAARAAEAEQAAVRAEIEAARRHLVELEGELDPPGRSDEAAVLRAVLTAAEAARDEALRLRERLARVERLDATIAAERAALAEAEAQAAELATQGKSLAFDSKAHEAALTRRRAARDAHGAAQQALTEARLREHGLSERLSERRVRLDAELARRSELAAKEDDARHLGRLAELLGEFRNSLVGQVGPALSAQTTALFRELTDGRFDRLDVDADTFELRLGAAGEGHPLDRHSGSETDLANLSLRVAVGEQVNLLSGGQVGLLVLDEVLGSLDAEHRDRLLCAISRLGARFRQVLVVTHASEVKEQLPAAVEVIPVARGHSRAQLSGAVLALAAAG